MLLSASVSKRGCFYAPQLSVMRSGDCLVVAYDQLGTPGNSIAGGNDADALSWMAWNLMRMRLGGVTFR
jgi:hypothetical protein